MTSCDIYGHHCGLTSTQHHHLLNYRISLRTRYLFLSQWKSMVTGVKSVDICGIHSALRELMVTCELYLNFAQLNVLIRSNAEFTDWSWLLRVNSVQSCRSNYYLGCLWTGGAPPAAVCHPVTFTHHHLRNYRISLRTRYLFLSQWESIVTGVKSVDICDIHSA